MIKQSSSSWRFFVWRLKEIESAPRIACTPEPRYWDKRPNEWPVLFNYSKSTSKRPPDEMKQRIRRSVDFVKRDTARAWQWRGVESLLASNSQIVTSGNGIVSIYRKGGNALDLGRPLPIVLFTAVPGTNDSDIYANALNPTSIIFISEHRHSSISSVYLVGQRPGSYLLAFKFCLAIDAQSRKQRSIPYSQWHYAQKSMRPSTSSVMPGLSRWSCLPHLDQRARVT